jgi:hypothetical protein
MPVHAVHGLQLLHEQVEFRGVVPREDRRTHQREPQRSLPPVQGETVRRRHGQPPRGEGPVHEGVLPAVLRPPDRSAWDAVAPLADRFRERLEGLRRSVGGREIGIGVTAVTMSARGATD